MHKFDLTNKNKLDNEWRRQNLPPTKTLEQLGLKPYDMVADISCGIGYFSIPAAEMLTDRNKVFALDTSEKMLAEVDKRALAAGVTNIITLNTEEYDLKLPDDSISFALLVNVFHEIDDRKRFISEIKRILKPEGKLAVVEWKKEEMEMGPQVAHRIGVEETVGLMAGEGLAGIDETEFAGVFYGVVFINNG